MNILKTLSHFIKQKTTPEAVLGVRSFILGAAVCCFSVSAAQQAEARPPIQTFPAGNGAAGLAFDGANIWVTDDHSPGTVSKLRASDGTLLGIFPVGSTPGAVAFDGENIWVANINSDDVTELSASDGETLNTVAVGVDPESVLFDGQNIWVGNFASDSVTKIRPSDAQVLGTYSAGFAPQGLASDGTYLWVVNEFSNTVTKLRTSDGGVVATFPVPTVYGDLRAITLANGSLYVADFANNQLVQISAADGTFLGATEIGKEPIQVTTDGLHIWVSNIGTRRVSALSLTDASIRKFRVGGEPLGILYDGESIWVANSGDSTVTKIPVTPPK